MSHASRSGNLGQPPWHPWREGRPQGESSRGGPWTDAMTGPRQTGCIQTEKGMGKKKTRKLDNAGNSRRVVFEKSLGPEERLVTSQGRHKPDRWPVVWAVLRQHITVILRPECPYLFAVDNITSSQISVAAIPHRVFRCVSKLPCDFFFVTKCCESASLLTVLILP